jgi:FkbM family methyltransferase
MQKISKISEIKIRFARVIAYTIRVKSLGLARWAFKKYTEERVLERPFYKKILHIDVSKTDTHRILFLEGERFVKERVILKPLLDKGMTVADVGANIGYHTLFFAHHVGAEGSIFAFEPDQNNVHELHANVEKNNLRQVRVVESAVGDEVGNVGFRSELNGFVDETSSQSVSATTIDSTFSDESVDLMKIDVEGFELKALRGAQNVISRDRPHLFVEVHPNLISGSHSEIIHLLSKKYSKIKAYYLKENITDKMLYRYFGKSPFREENIDRFMESYSGEKRFWVLCKG